MTVEPLPRGGATVGRWPRQARFFPLLFSKDGEDRRTDGQADDGDAEVTGANA